MSDLTKNLASKEEREHRMQELENIYNELVEGRVPQDHDAWGWEMRGMLRNSPNPALAVQDILREWERTADSSYSEWERAVEEFERMVVIDKLVTSAELKGALAQATPPEADHDEKTSAGERLVAPEPHTQPKEFEPKGTFNPDLWDDFLEEIAAWGQDTKFSASKVITYTAVFTTLPASTYLVLLSLVLAITLSFFRKLLPSMSKSSKSSKTAPRTTTSPEFTAALSQFMGVTGLPAKDATKFIQKYGRADLAIDAYFSDPGALTASNRRESQTQVQNQTQKLNALFDRYKSPDDPDLISIDGTLKLCAELDVDPEDVVLLAVAYELKASGVGEFARVGWRDGWRALGVDSVAGMKNTLPRLRRSLGSDFAYFKRVYLFTFDFARSEGQRSLATETAQAFWSLLLPHAIHGGALAHVADEEDEDVPMGDGDDGWTDEHTQWWFDFLNEKGSKGVSRDTWNMFISFARTIDPRFQQHDIEAAWPSTVDDFVEWAKENRVPPS